MTSHDLTTANCEALEPAARTVLSEAAYDYYAGGAEDETDAARQPRRVRPLLPAPARAGGRERGRHRRELLGERLSMPILLAPTAFQRLAHPEGEIATARAAARPVR